MSSPPPAPAPAEDTDYESDPEDAPLPSMRRREASDDESNSDGGAPLPSRRDPRGGAAFEEELDGQGAAPGDDEDEEYGDEEDVEDEVEEEVVVEEKAEERAVSPPAEEVAVDGKNPGGDQAEQAGVAGEGEAEAGEKKENEPYAVPTAGAFYMHDDRFQENGRGRGRRMLGGRKLWETKDDHAWLHDRFEEMNLQDVRHNEVRQMSRGRFGGRGPGSIRGTGRGYGRANRPQAYYERSNYDQNNYDRSDYDRGNDRSYYDRSNDRSNYDRSNYDRRTYNRSNDDRRTYDRSNDDRRTYDRSNDDRRTYDRSNDDRRTYDRSNDDRRTSDRSNDDRRTYDRSNDDRRTYDRRNDDRRNYDRRNDDRRNYDRRNDDRRNYDRSNGRSNYDRSIDRSHFDRGNGQSYVPKFLRGRGPRRYVPAQKNNSEVPATQQKPPSKPQELMPNSTVGRKPQTSTVQPDPVLPRKHVFSNLNSASPPFYPSGSSNLDISANQRRHVLAGSTNHPTFSSSMQMNDYFPATQSDPFLKGKATVDTVSHDRLYMNASLPVNAGKSVINPRLQSSGSSLSPPSPIQSSYSGIPGNGINVLPNYQQPLNQVARAPLQHPSSQQRSHQAPLQPALQSSIQQLGQQPVSEHQASSPPQAPATDSFETNGSEPDSPLGSVKSKTSMVEKGKSGNPGSEKGSFLYNGAQIMGAAGAMGLQTGDQGFPATPALLPVMQFGGQHHGGLGVPAVGMALPGYVAQSQLGFGNSEMTWLPMLTGAAGTLGASYPYIALDSSYYNRSSGQTSSGSSRETSLTGPVTTQKPPQGPEIVNDEFAQRQNKPRRYSEMNFGQ